MSITTTIDGIPQTKTTRDFVIHVPEDGAAQVQVFTSQTVTIPGLVPITTDLGCTYQAPLLTCFAGPSTAALAAAAGKTPNQMKAALIAWFDALAAEGVIQ